MTRMTNKEFAALDQILKRREARESGKPQKLRKPRVPKRHDELPENQVEGQIVDYLRTLGWTVTKQHVGTFRKGGNSFFKFGKLGDPDWRCEKPRYAWSYLGRNPEPSAECLLMFLEIKAPGKKASVQQAGRILELRRLGFVAECFDSYDSFLRWYRGRFSPAP